MLLPSLERSADGPAIDALLDHCFGPGHRAKTVYCLREDAAPVPGLCLTLRDRGDLVGSIRYWPILAGGAPGLLLGPVVVAPEHQGRGLGARLIRESLARATAGAHGFILLVGDALYYRRFGFEGVADRFQMPGPVDADRFLGLELMPGAMPAGGQVTTRRWHRSRAA